MLTDSQLSALKLAAEALHRDIMNLPIPMGADGFAESPRVYSLGFRDARHAAAELVTARNADLSAIVDELADLQRRLHDVDPVLDMARRFVNMTRYVAGPSVPTAEAWLGKLREAVEKYDSARAAAKASDAK